MADDDDDVNARLLLLQRALGYDHASMAAFLGIPGHVWYNCVRGHVPQLPRPEPLSDHMASLLVSKIYGLDRASLREPGEPTDYKAWKARAAALLER
jgi:hypothetical protein